MEFENKELNQNKINDVFIENINLKKALNENTEMSAKMKGNYN